MARIHLMVLPNHKGTRKPVFRTSREGSRIQHWLPLCVTGHRSDSSTHSTGDAGAQTREPCDPQGQPAETNTALASHGEFCLKNHGQDSGCRPKKTNLKSSLGTQGFSIHNARPHSAFLSHPLPSPWLTWGHESEAFLPLVSTRVYCPHRCHDNFFPIFSLVQISLTPSHFFYLKELKTFSMT